jgi:PadR family transcriptional regulator
MSSKGAKSRQRPDVRRPAREPRLTLQGLKILDAFLLDPQTPLSGADVQRRTRLLSGTIYPILMRFEQVGWLSSEWEEIDPSEAGRPRCRFYRITAEGQRAAVAALESVGGARVFA